jgi:hypothetical protein
MFKQVVWWADSTVGLALSIYIIYEGAQSMQVSYCHKAVCCTAKTLILNELCSTLCHANDDTQAANNGFSLGRVVLDAIMQTYTQHAFAAFILQC